MKPANTGHTLTGLTVALAVIGIMAGLSVPALTRQLAATEVTSASRLLHSHISRARSAALSRHLPVVLCARPLPDPGMVAVRCAPTANWSNGWWLFVDADGNNRLDAADTLLATGQPLTRGVRIAHGSMQSRRRYIRFGPHGTAWPNSSFVVCAARARGAGRRVVVYYTGRARITQTRPTDCPEN